MNNNSATELDKIWENDLLNRRSEATSIQKFIESEISFKNRVGRHSSLVLAIDAPYGRGKTWFLERLALQLELNHPVAKIDAWADDTGDEPLTAFMAAIDVALAPYLSTSTKLGDKLAAAKASALPIIGKLVTGAAIKGLTKVAGDEIQDQIGDEIEAAVRGAKSALNPQEEGAAALALTEAMSKLSTEIDSLVDRRGAAMLAAYRQRRHSRDAFRQNMRNLVAAIDEPSNPKKAPLIVIIDELDRCRPIYAIKILEEIKHFFEIPNIVFLISLHRGQLSKSICSVYGESFDSEDYLRRFFTRKYDLLESPTPLLVKSIISDSSIDLSMLRFPNSHVPAQDLDNSDIIANLIFDRGIAPRDCFEIIDGIRIFINNWNYQCKIDGIALLCLIVKNSLGQPLEFAAPRESGKITFSGLSWVSPNGANPKAFSADQYLRQIPKFINAALIEFEEGGRSSDPARNSLVNFISEERSHRSSLRALSRTSLPYLGEYIERVREVGRFAAN